MGSDTCGSIRIPAANQNLVGLRGTHGLSSRTGVMPLSSTQDIAGPLARTVTDLAIMLDATVGADPADAITKDSAGHIPKSYREALVDGGLKGARIGALRSLWGTAGEDGEVTGIMNKALDGMKAQGAEVVDITVPGLDDLLRESSVINDEFKFDLMAYLAKQPNAPVKSLGEADRARPSSRRVGYATSGCAIAPQKRETEHYRQALVKRRATRAAVLATLEEQRIDVLAYPTLRRKTGRDRRRADRHQLPVERDHGITGDLDSRRVHHRWPPDRSRVVRWRVDRSHAAEICLRVGAGHQTAPRAVQHAAAREGRGAGGRLASDITIGAATVKLNFDRTTGALRYDVTTANMAHRSRGGADHSAQRRRQAGPDRRAPVDAESDRGERHVDHARPRSRGSRRRPVIRAFLYAAVAAGGVAADQD